MEVHAPHEPIHTWRDFFIHIATITIGLLIAIGLEQTVEWFHHRHVVHVARENIRHEIEINRGEASANLTAVQADEDSMKQNIVKGRALRLNPHALDQSHINTQFSWSSFNEAAWISARDSGALTYMPPEEVQRYADVYNQQDIVNRTAVTIFTSQIELAAPLLMEEKTSDLRPEDIHTMMRDSALSQLRLVVLHQLIEQLEQQFAATLKQ